MNKTIVSFGEIMLRLSPPDNGMICDSRQFSACYGGSESNVLVALSCLGNKTRFLTAVPENELGNAVIRHLCTYNVDTDRIVRRGDTLGMYFLENGFGKRPAKVIYNRRHAEVAGLSEVDFDYDSVFADCGLFHICGISFALSESSRKLSFRLLAEAKKRRIPVSFDFNYRSKLWTVEEAAKVYREIIEYVDILFCSERDLSTFLGTDVKNFYTKYNTTYLIVREREVLAEGKHAAHARMFRKIAENIECTKTPKTEFQVLERIGAGDAFVGGVLHALCADSGDIAGALQFGMTCFVLKHTVKGDVFTMDANTVKAYLNDLAKDVSR